MAGGSASVEFVGSKESTTSPRFPNLASSEDACRPREFPLHSDPLDSALTDLGLSF